MDTFNDWKLLLPQKNIQTNQGVDAYGLIKVIAETNGFKYPLNIFTKNLIWQHGWTPDYWQYSIESLMGVQYNEGACYVVAKKTNSAFIQSLGHKNAVAAGIAPIYLPKKEIERMPNSLLVMPTHSVSFTTHDHWAFKEYVEDIKEIAHLFDKIVICVHPACIDKGYWVTDFKEAGFEVVEGMTGMDLNALYRLQVLMSSFEYVTTNGFGSHIAYAAYFGAKISIYGTFAEYKEEDFINEEFYQKNLDTLKFVVAACSEKLVKQELSFLFGHPKEAIVRQEWGNYELGLENKLSKKELYKLFGWNTWNILKTYYFSLNGIKYQLAKILPKTIKDKLKTVLKIS